MVGKSAPTIQSIELNSGRLKLSPELAMRISHETGAGLRWLLSGDPKFRPIDLRGNPYTSEVFKTHRAFLNRGDQTRDPKDLTMDSMAVLTFAMGQILEDARRKGKIEIVQWKLMEAMALTHSEEIASDREPSGPVPFSLPNEPWNQTRIVLFFLNFANQFFDVVKNGKNFDVVALMAPPPEIPKFNGLKPPY